MPNTILDDIDSEQTLSRAADPAAPERMVRIALAKDWPGPVELKWCAGHIAGNQAPPARETRIVLKPGKSVTQPLSKAEAWWGPFSRFDEYEHLEPGPVREMLRNHIAVESSRVILRYDWPKGNGRELWPDMTQRGHNRMPDVTCTVIYEDGTERAVRLYQVYKLGEFDPLKDTYVKPKSQAEMEDEFRQQLDERDRELVAMRLEVAKLSGQFQGAVEGAVASRLKNGDKSAKEKAPAVPA